MGTSKEKQLTLNTRKVMENFAHIIDKDRKDRVLKFNAAQSEVYEVIKKRKKAGKQCKIIILKARQLGMSTFTECFGVTRCVLEPNQSMIIITHEEKASQNLYSMTHHCYENFPSWLTQEAQTIRDNQNIMELTNGSKIQTMVASPNSSGTGRGQTISIAHLSEFAFWGGDSKAILAGLSSAFTKQSVVIIESTANGCNEFKTMWDNAVADQLAGNDNGYIPLFFPWYTDPEYTDPYWGFELTKEEESLKKRFNLTNEQLAWRRNKIRSDFSNDVALFNQEYPATPEDAFISSGKCIFDLNVINERKLDLREQEVQFEDKGYFLYDIEYDSYLNERKIKNYKWVSDHKNGYITLHKKVGKRLPYVLAIDPAGDGSDFTAMNVLDNRSCEQVCVTHVNGLQSFEIACQAYCLGMYYNEALIASETNFAPEVMTNLKELGYPNLYITQTEGNNMLNGLQKKYGFRTTTVTRPYLISMLIEYVNKNFSLLNNYQTLIEAENFVRVYKVIDGKTKQKEQANAGAHDDLLMSLGIALYVRDSNQQTFDLLPETEVYEEKISEFDRMFGTYDFNESEGEYLTYD